MSTMYDYIPKYPMSISVGGEEINISGIYAFKIEVERCLANYSVWVDTVQINPLLPPGKRNCILLTPIEYDSKEAVFNMPNISLNCKIKKVSYISRRHGYVIDLDCTLNSKFLTKFKYVEPGVESKKDIDRFDLMEFDDDV